MARSANPDAAPAPAPQDDSKVDPEVLMAPWRKDPAFNRWLDKVVEQVQRGSTIDRVKEQAGVPSNDLILGAHLMRQQMSEALIKALYTDPTPKSKQKAQVVQLNEGRGFEMR
jgi:hypothetical protein